MVSVLLGSLGLSGSPISTPIARILINSSFLGFVEFSSTALLLSFPKWCIAYAKKLQINTKKITNMFLKKCLFFFFLYFLEESFFFSLNFVFFLFFEEFFFSLLIIT